MIYVFLVAGVGCEIGFVGTIDNILDISVRVRPGCSISWVGAIISLQTIASWIKKIYILKQEL